jgi:RsiW-degrading membrane proteinase PrsW (M82 family)
MWGNVIIFTVAVVAGYQYYVNTSDFVANPNPVATFADGWNGVNKSGTLIFLMLIIVCTLLPLFIYRSDPWKQPLYKNVILTVIIVVNSVLFFAIYYTTSYLSFLDLVPIGTK